MASPGHHQTNGQAEREIRELKTALRDVTNLCLTNWLTSLSERVAYSNTGQSETINMFPYKAVSGREYYPLFDTDRVNPSAIHAPDDYYNRYQESRNAAYQALNLARARSTRTAAKRRNECEPVMGRGMVMICGDQFGTESVRSRILQPR